MILFNFLQIVALAAFLGILIVANAKPLDDPKNAQIISYESDNIGIDGYRFA